MKLKDNRVPLDSHLLQCEIKYLFSQALDLKDLPPVSVQLIQVWEELMTIVKVDAFGECREIHLAYDSFNLSLDEMSNMYLRPCVETFSRVRNLKYRRFKTLKNKLRSMNWNRSASML